MVGNMASGKTILRSLDRELHEARESALEQTRVLSRSSRYLADVRQEQSDRYRRLATLRLDQIREQEVAAELDATDRHAKNLLQRHDELLAQAAGAVEEAARTIEGLEAEREAQEARTEEALTALEEAIEATRARLAQEPAYVERERAVQAAREVAARAARKAELARTDRVEKGAPYEADPLFMYLWERRYGTDAYEAFPLFRTLDGWVAGLCGYGEARRNYRLLTELPERMEEHAQRVAADAEEAEVALARLEEEAFLADGHGATRERATREEEALAEIDRRLDEAEARHLERSRQHAALAAGTDPTYREALETVLGTLRGKDLSELREEVARTPLPEDDVLVEELVELEGEQAFLEERVAQESSTVEACEKVLRDLEWVRRKFKAAHFDGPHAAFPGEGFLAALVSQLTRRAISRDTFWTSLRRRYRSKAPQLSLPTGLPRGSSRSGAGAWIGTLGRLARTSFPTVRSSSFGGGGFRTGGRMGGGGGFKTGGGF